MRVLVTGATGFVGGVVARRLVEVGHEVLATGRDLRKGVELGVPFQAGSLDCAQTALALCQDKEAVVHCAAFSSPWGSEDQFRIHNEMVTSNLLAAEVPRFVHISSAGVYFQQDERLDVCESDTLPRDNHHPYLNSKRRAERLVEQTQGWVILRPRAIYGPGDTAILPRLLRLMKPGLLPVFGNGTNLASLTHVSNLALACELALEGPTEKVYNVADGEPVHLWTLLRTVAEELNMPPIRWRLPDRPAWLLAGLLELLYARLGAEPPLSRYTLSLLTKSQTLNLAKIRHDLGYQPHFDTAEGVLRTISQIQD